MASSDPDSNTVKPPQLIVQSITGKYLAAESTTSKVEITVLISGTSQITDSIVSTIRTENTLDFGKVTLARFDKAYNLENPIPQDDKVKFIVNVLDDTGKRILLGQIERGINDLRDLQGGREGNILMELLS